MFTNRLRLVLSICLLCIPGLSLATPGAVDKDDCHKGGELNMFHCHGSGSEETLNTTHFLIGSSVRADVWLYNNGPMNRFIGGSIDAEYSGEHLGMRGGFSYQPHQTGDPSFLLTGWDFGVKLGNRISHRGGHLYVHGGMFGQKFSQPSIGLSSSLFGYQLGLGYIQNFSNIAVDARAIYKSPAAAANMWDSYGAPGLTWHLASQLGIFYRF